jgi:regulator of ribonuclease activity A
VKSVATADLCDRFGDEVAVVQPGLRDWGGVLVFGGMIETLRVFEDNALVRRLLEREGQGRVLVVDGGGSLRTALVGGNLAALAQNMGWAGLVVNGAVRDTSELRATALGVRALATTPRKSAKPGVGEHGIAVSFGGVTFEPGRFLYADGDGIVVAPRDLTLV